MNLLQYVMGGIETWVNPPLLRDLRVRTDTRQNDIVFLDMEALWRGAPDEWAGCRISVNLATREIDWGYTSPELFDRQRKGSGAIGAAVMTIPVALALSPYIAVRRTRFAKLERERGMSRFSSVVLDFLEGHVDGDTWDALKETFRKTWERDQYLARDVTLDEAKRLLATCTLREYVETSGARFYTWFDGTGTKVAYAHVFVGGPTDVYVLGSLFRRADADQLTGLYGNRIVRTQEQDEDEVD